MKTYPDDKIITADEARRLAKTRFDDSVVREDFREVMQRVREAAFYGHMQVGYFTKYKMKGETLKELEKLGFLVTYEDIEYSKKFSHHNEYYCTVKWGEKVVY